MISSSLKRIVLTIVDASRDVSDAWKKRQAKRQINQIQMINALNRLERAVQRLDRIANAKEKTNSRASS